MKQQQFTTVPLTVIGLMLFVIGATAKATQKPPPNGDMILVPRSEVSKIVYPILQRYQYEATSKWRTSGFHV